MAFSTDPTRRRRSEQAHADPMVPPQLLHGADPTASAPAVLVHATLAQWQLVAAGVAQISNWTLPTRIATWNVRQLAGHLVVVAEAIAPTLRQPPSSEAPVTVYEVMAGAPARAADNDARARQVADDAQGAILAARLQAAVDDAAGALSSFGASVAGDLHLDDPSVTHVAPTGSALADAVLPTRFGPLALRHFLVHRIVEGVVHGLDLPEPVTPAPDALAVAATALAFLAHLAAPGLHFPVLEDPVGWIEMATGRCPPTPELSSIVPVLR